MPATTTPLQNARARLLTVFGWCYDSLGIPVQQDPRADEITAFVAELDYEQCNELADIVFVAPVLPTDSPINVLNRSVAEWMSNFTQASENFRVKFLS